MNRRNKTSDPNGSRLRAIRAARQMEEPEEERASKYNRFALMHSNSSDHECPRPLPPARGRKRYGDDVVASNLPFTEIPAE